MKDKEETILNLKHFRNVSIYFYMTSFLMITIMFVFYLVGSKNNRSCQYGSTLFCNTEKFFYTGFKEGGSYLEIDFKQPLDSITANTRYTIKYPYNSTDYYNVDYYFNNAAPAAVTNFIDSDTTNMGVSINGTVGASIYFTNSSRPEGITLNKITEFVIIKSGITTFKILTPDSKTASDSIMDYYYPTSQSAPNPIIVPTISTNDSFFSASVVPWNSANPVKSNWISLLNKNTNQHKYGCSPGNLAACACIDPSYVSSIMCNDLVLNKNSGLYCPAKYPDCTTPCTIGNTDEETDCGYRFCTSGVIPAAPDKTSTTRQLYGKGSYQNAFIPGMKDTSSQDLYRVGYGGTVLADNLGIASLWKSGDETLIDYAQVQLNNMCAGTIDPLVSGSTGFNGNNINNSTSRSPGVNITGSGNVTGYTPQFSTHPNFSNDSFNF